MVDSVFCFFFFFQAEDGIRDADVTGVQTCALPILLWSLFRMPSGRDHHPQRRYRASPVAADALAWRTVVFGFPGCYSPDMLTTDVCTRWPFVRGDAA